MTKFPVDAPKTKVVKTLALLGFRIVREREHIAMVRDNPGRHSNAANDAQSFSDQRFDLTHDLHSIRNFARRFF